MGPDPRIRYRNDVTADHIGQRVSVRSMDAAGTPRDVVGRLLAIDAEVLLIVDRAARLHVVSRPHLMASKVVPAHPRLPAEPNVGGRDAPFERDAARLLVIQGSEVLLVAHHPTADETVWTAPGGGLDGSEDPRRAAERELLEETGLALSAGALVLRRTATFPFRGVWITQHEQWFLAETTSGDLQSTHGGHSDAASQASDPATSTARWWPVNELAATQERIEPSELPAMIRTLIETGPPDQPWELGPTTTADNDDNDDLTP
ncbi:MAG: NUDIX domain-containing protein [Nitriliruptoraceae bacterium]